MVEKFKKNWKKVLGAILIVLGFAALVTPLTPGAWLIFIGAEMLGIGFLSRENFFRYHTRVKQWWSGKSKEEEREVK